MSPASMAAGSLGGNCRIRPWQASFALPLQFDGSSVAFGSQRVDECVILGLCFVIDSVSLAKRAEPFDGQPSAHSGNFPGRGTSDHIGSSITPAGTA